MPRAGFDPYAVDQSLEYEDIDAQLAASDDFMRSIGSGEDVTVAPSPQQRERSSSEDGAESETSSEGSAEDEEEPGDGVGGGHGHVRVPVQVARRKDYEGRQEASRLPPNPEDVTLDEAVAITVDEMATPPEDEAAGTAVDEKAAPPPKVKLWQLVEADRLIRGDFRYRDKTGHTDDDAILEALLIDLYESHSGDMVAIFEELELPADEALKHRPSLDTTPQKFAHRFKMGYYTSIDSCTSGGGTVPSAEAADATGGQDLLDDCPICLETLFQAPQRLPCGHEYCTACIVKIRATQAEEHEQSLRGGGEEAPPRCPMCRAPIPHDHRYMVLQEIFDKIVKQKHVKYHDEAWWKARERRHLARAGLLGDDYIEGRSAPNCWIWFGRPISLLLFFVGVFALTIFLTAKLAMDECGSNRSAKQLRDAGCR